MPVFAVFIIGLSLVAFSLIPHPHPAEHYHPPW